MVDLNLVKPEHLWYAIGFIATDGSLSIDRRHIYLTSKDEDLLISIRDSLFLKNKIGKKARGSEKVKKYSTLQFGDVKFYDFLLNIGLMPRKSLTLGALKVVEEYFVDFLRGVIDGDGNIHTFIHTTNKNVQWTLRIYSAAHDFIYWLKDKVEERFSINGTIQIRKDKNRTNPLYVLRFGKFASKVILRETYYEDCLALERKLQKAKKCLESEDKLRTYGVFKASNYIA